MAKKNNIIFSQLFTELEQDIVNIKKYILVNEEKLSIERLHNMIEELQLCCEEKINIYFHSEFNYILVDNKSAAETYGPYEEYQEPKFIT